MALGEKAAQDKRGIDSIELSERLGTDTPRNIPSLLTTSLKRRAKALGLPVPWDERVSPENRTVWADRDGIAHRMIPAIFDEEQRRIPEIVMEDGSRHPHPADDVGGPHTTEHLARLAARAVVEDA